MMGPITDQSTVVEIDYRDLLPGLGQRGAANKR
jgi:hypothetical protein